MVKIPPIRMEIVLAKEDTAVTKSEPWDTQNNTMLSRWKQSTKTLLFRVVKTCVDCLPGWLLRFRPFGVYEIRFADCEADSSGSTNASDAAAAVSISWITDREQLTKLTDIAAEENLQAWDGATRRVAIAWREGRPVGAAWIARETFAEPDLGLSYRLQPDEAWLFAAVVQPEHRRQGIYGHLLRFLIDELADEQLSRLLLGISHRQRRVTGRAYQIRSQPNRFDLRGQESGLRLLSNERRGAAAILTYDMVAGIRG